MIVRGDPPTTRSFVAAATPFSAVYSSLLDEPPRTVAPGSTFSLADTVRTDDGQWHHAALVGLDGR